MADIKLLRLTTGEDVVAEVTFTNASMTTIKKPFVLIPMAQNPSQNAPKTDIRDNYLNYVGAIVPVENKIIS